jgi:hypothetical protein
MFSCRAAQALLHCVPPPVPHRFIFLHSIASLLATVNVHPPPWYYFVFCPLPLLVVNSCRCFSLYSTPSSLHVIPYYCACCPSHVDFDSTIHSVAILLRFVLLRSWILLSLVNSLYKKINTRGTLCP